MRRVLGPVGGPVAFVLVAGLVFTGLGWVTVTALGVEEAQRQAAAEARVAGDARLALWRLDARLLPALGVENARTFLEYAPPDPAAPYGPTCDALLSGPLPGWMELHVQLDPDTDWRSPQVLTPEARDLFKAAWPELQPVNATPERAHALSVLRKKHPHRQTYAAFAAGAAAPSPDGRRLAEAPPPKMPPPSKEGLNAPAPPPADPSHRGGERENVERLTAPTDGTAAPQSAPVPAPAPAPPPRPAAVAADVMARGLDRAEGHNELVARRRAADLAEGGRQQSTYIYPPSNTVQNFRAPAGEAQLQNGSALGRNFAAPAGADRDGVYAKQQDKAAAGSLAFGAAGGKGDGSRKADDARREAGSAGDANLSRSEPSLGGLMDFLARGGKAVPEKEKDAAAKDALRMADAAKGKAVEPLALAAEPKEPRGFGGFGGGMPAPAAGRGSGIGGGGVGGGVLAPGGPAPPGLAGPSALTGKADPPGGYYRVEQVPPAAAAAAAARMMKAAGPKGGTDPKAAPPAPAASGPVTIVPPPAAPATAPAAAPKAPATALGVAGAAPPGPTGGPQAPAPDPGPRPVLQPAGPPPPPVATNLADVPAPPAFGFAPPAVAVHLGPVRPQWLTADDGKDTLVLVRTARLDGRTVYQGVVLDWLRLQEALKEDIKDLFPEAKLVPVKVQPEVPSDWRMTALPVQLDPGPPAAAVEPAMWTPLRIGLALAWVAALIAFGALGLAGWSLIDLSERRIRFVSAVTHELRTPLTSLRLYLDLLLSGMVQDEQKRTEYLSTLACESDRLHRLVDNVLDFARLERRRVGTDLKPAKVADLLASVRDTWSDRCGADGKELIVVSTLPPDAAVTTDAALVGQIVGNLIDNARKYARGASDPRVWVWARPEGRRVVLEVEDRGPGVPPRERGLIFRPFRRGSGADATAGGAGLGLALCKQWAESLGGTLTYRPADGDTGSCFRLELPAK